MKTSSAYDTNAQTKELFSRLNNNQFSKIVNICALVCVSPSATRRTAARLSEWVIASYFWMFIILS